MAFIAFQLLFTTKKIRNAVADVLDFLWYISTALPADAQSAKKNFNALTSTHIQGLDH